MSTMAHRLEQLDRSRWAAVKPLFPALLIDFALWVIAILPFCITAHLPLSDLPNHLARQHVLATWSESEALQTYYQPYIVLMPNLAFDGFVQFFRHIVGIEPSARLFCIVTVTMLAAGVRLVGSWIDPGTRVYRVAPLLIYGGPLQFGFLSFCFGIGLALLLLGSWVRRRDVSMPRLLAIFAPATLVLIACHLAAFAVFALIVGAWEISAAFMRREGVSGFLRRQARLAAFLVPPFALMQLAGDDSVQHEVVFSTVQQKIESILAIMLFSTPWLELALLALAGGGLLMALLLRALRLHPASWFVLPVLVGAWLVAPRSAAGGGYVDYRLPWVIALVILALTVRGERWDGTKRWLSAMFLGLTLTRVISIAALWLAWEPVIADIDTALGRLPQGARLTVVQGNVGSVSEARRPSLLHAAAYAVLRRDAFEPQLYANVAGQTLKFDPRWAPLSEMTPPTSIRQINPAFTHLLVIDPNEASVARGIDLQQIAEGSRFQLFAVSRAPLAQRSLIGGLGAPCLRPKTPGHADSEYRLVRSSATVAKCDR